MRRNLAPGCISSDVKLCQRKLLFPFFREPLFLGPLVFFFLFFLSPAKVGSLEMQPGAKLQAYLGVSILQPLDFESFGQMLDGRVLGASQVEYKPFGKPPLKKKGRLLRRRRPLRRRARLPLPPGRGGAFG